MSIVNITNYKMYKVSYIAIGSSYLRGMGNPSLPNVFKYKGTIRIAVVIFIGEMQCSQVSCTCDTFYSVI